VAREVRAGRGVRWIERCNCPEPEGETMARVLVVDDDSDMLDALEMWLGREHDVLRATSVKDAMALIAEVAPPDVILTDYDLGRGTGDELLAWVAVQYPQMRRILHTGTPRERLDGAAALAHRVVKKGSSLEQISEAVNDFFRPGSCLMAAA
jgi:DNA-binding NtrC family response regulator